ncbi:MAG: 30S ribosomal protein S15 [Candidatus Bathyarchaeia archaeon]
MARLYSRKKGKSGSTRPVSKKPPAWCKYAPEEVEALVVKLSREGYSQSAIGAILRDKHGIPLVKQVTGKTIGEIMRAEGLAPRIPEDLGSLLKKAESMRKHLERHRSDYVNKRALALIESKIHRLSKYYIRKGILGPDWKYAPAVASVT